MLTKEKIKRFVKRNQVELAIVGVSASILGAYYAGLYLGIKYSELTDAHVFMDRNTGETFLYVLKASGEWGRYPWAWSTDMIKYISEDSIPK